MYYRLELLQSRWWWGVGSWRGVPGWSPSTTSGPSRDSGSISSSSCQFLRYFEI